MNVRRPRELWKRFWFSPGTPYDLAAARVIIAANALWLLLSRDLPGMAAVPDDFWAGLRTSTQWRYGLFPGHPDVERLVQAVAILALIGAIVGLAPRIMCLMSAVTLYHLAALETAFHYPEPTTRGFGVAIVALVVLALSPCADVFSVGPRKNRGLPPEQWWQYRWPLLLVQVLVVQVYFFSGYAKLYWGGLSWISADNMARYLYLTNQWELGLFESIGPALAQSPLLMMVIALGTVVAELAFPLVLVFPKSRRVLIPMAGIFHVGILFTMNFAYPAAPQLLVFVNWDWVRRAWRWRLVGATPAPVPSGGPVVHDK